MNKRISADAEITNRLATWLLVNYRARSLSAAAYQSGIPSGEIEAKFMEHWKARNA